MCGIAGILSVGPDRGLGARVAGMTQALFHRGPDDGGVVAFGQVGGVTAARLGRAGNPVQMSPVAAHAAMGARRLAILDLSERGHQPMASRDRLAWIVHNGEIYNFIELRDALSADGWVFETGTDTEVVLAAWQAWGAACFERFDGMWATAIYEPDARRLILSRDRFGIKPLYFVQRPGLFAFASEIKALLMLPQIRRRVNLARLADFLCEGWLDHTDETLFDGIYSLPGGGRLAVTATESCALHIAYHHDLTVGGGRVRKRSHEPNPDPPLSTGEGGELRERLQRAVQLQLRSDVAVGSCLSGGIDSSAIVALLCQETTAQGAAFPQWTQHTFTAVLPGDPLDESRYADTLLAACPSLRGHRVEPTAEGLLANLDRMIWHQEEPFGSPSIYMQWEVMRLAQSAGVRVLLDGQGGDELFCGYSGYYPPWIAQLIRENRWGEAAELFRNPHVRRYFSRSGLAGHVLGHLLPHMHRAALRRQIRCRQHAWLDARLRSGRGMNSCGRGGGLPSSARTVAEPHRREQAFGQYWRDVLHRRSLPALLHFEDRSSMAFSIEARVPFLGRDPADFAAAIPADLKLRGGKTKAILRDALRGRVPDAILDRTDKIGFAAPTVRWMQRPLRHWWQDLLASGASKARGWVHVSKIDPIVERLDAGNGHAALILWRLAIAEQWAQKMIDAR